MDFSNILIPSPMPHCNQTEIQKVLDSVPETILQDVLDFLKALQNQPEYKVRMANNLRQILSEDKELLEKLAQ